MTTRKRHENLTRKPFQILILLAGIGVAFPAGPAYPDDWPSFRRGIWEFQRTIEGVGGQGTSQTIKNKKCTDPTEDMKKQNETLAKAGCKLSPISRSGNVYRFTSDCALQGMSAQGKSEIRVESDSAYTVHIETRQGKQVTKEVLKARRTGECP